MNDLSKGRPEASEFATYAKAYVDLVVGNDAIGALTAQSTSTRSLVGKIDERAAGERAYAPGKWTVKQVIGHMIDTERIFAYRSLCIARNDPRPLAGFEQDDYVAGADFNACRLSDLLDELESVRHSTILLFRNLAPSAWGRRGVANGYDVSVRGLAFVTAGHELHHLRILEEKYLS